MLRYLFSNHFASDGADDIETTTLPKRVTSTSKPKVLKIDRKHNLKIRRTETEDPVGTQHRKSRNNAGLRNAMKGRRLG